MTEIRVFNPANPTELVWSGAATTPAELVEMTRASRVAQKAWGRLDGRARHTQIAAFLDAVQARREALAERMVLEQGKLQGEALGEVTKSLVEARWMLGRCLESTGTIMASARPNMRAMRVKRPRGVVLAITPWNFPVLTPMRKIVPALVFGNAILVKPASDAPGTALLLQEAARETLPEGLVLVVLGGAQVAGAAITSVDVDAVTFTGSTDTGKKVMALAAEGLKEVSLELGGKNPAILHDPFDLEDALDHVVRAAFANGGQRCTAISRVLVHENLRNAATAGLISRISALRPGAGAEAGATLAALSNRAQFDRVCTFVKDLDPTETNVLTGGSVADRPGGGYFFEPTLVEVIDPQSKINFEEVFGPVLGLEFYSNINDAIKRANAPEYGLTASVFGTDIQALRQFEEEIEAGMIHVNHGTFPDENMPFGGWKASGVGAPSVGQDADQFFTRIQAVYEGV
jgi:alpha-ketoglutaric semialdehyde dehydrogenase